MKRFCTLALLLSVVSVQAHAAGSQVWGAPGPFLPFPHPDRPKANAPAPTLTDVLNGYFKYDLLESPLAGPADASSRLADTVASYMQQANEKILNDLFYDPKVAAWQNLYRQVEPNKTFSTVDLINLLDTTKTKIFNAYQNKEYMEGDAYFYIPTLFDNAMQKIFAGCWGISDKPVDQRILDNLKQVYGRVVQGVLLTGDEETQKVSESLNSKKTAHFNVLQQIFNTVKSNPQSPLQGINHHLETVETTMRDLLNPARERAKDRDYPMLYSPYPGDQDKDWDQKDVENRQLFKRFGLLSDALGNGTLNGATIGTLATKIISRLNPETQAQDVTRYVSYLAQNLLQDKNKLSLAPLQQDTLLNAFEEALRFYRPTWDKGNSPFEDRHYKWISLFSDSLIFDVTKIFPRFAENFRTVTPRTDIDSFSFFPMQPQQGQRTIGATQQIIKVLKDSTKGLSFLKTSQNQKGFVDSLEGALKGNKAVQKEGEEYQIWMALLQKHEETQEKSEVILGSQRTAIIQKALQSLEKLDDDFILKKELPELYNKVEEDKEKQIFIDEVKNAKKFKALGDNRQTILQELERQKKEHEEWEQRIRQVPFSYPHPTQSWGQPSLFDDGDDGLQLWGPPYPLSPTHNNGGQG